MKKRQPAEVVSSKVEDAVAARMCPQTAVSVQWPGPPQGKDRIGGTSRGGGRWNSAGFHQGPVGLNAIL